jgi:hypothetical protein
MQKDGYLINSALSNHPKNVDVAEQGLYALGNLALAGRQTSTIIVLILTFR